MKIKLVLLFILLYSSLYSQADFSKINYDSVFSGYKGLFLVCDTSGKEIFSYNSDIANIQKSPCSTFKILNSLISLEAGSIKDENEIIKWDGVKRWNPDWNKDQNLKSAFENSTVWFYQELARRNGHEVMKKYLDLCNYGNKDMSSGLDKFWLDASLKISAEEQLAFLKKFYKEELPFSPTNYKIVKNIMIYAKGDDFILRGKTGSNGEDIGWFIGYMEHKNDVYIFVAQINGKDASGPMVKKWVRAIFGKILNINYGS